MTVLDDALRPVKDQSYQGKQSIKREIKELFEILITESRVSEKLPNGEDFSYLNEALLRQKIGEL